MAPEVGRTQSATPVKFVVIDSASLFTAAASSGSTLPDCL
jgi:hypothetical protein